jgi:CheY-like chemotaxis protein
LDESLVSPIFLSGQCAARAFHFSETGAMTELNTTAASNEKKPRGVAIVADDGYVERMLGRAMLEKIGYTVTTAENGTQTLRLLLQQHVDLLLCDIQMPGITGLEILAQIERFPSHRPRPIVVLCTGHFDLQLDPNTHNQTLVTCLAKPLSIRSLQAAIDGLTEGDRPVTAPHWR